AYLEAGFLERIMGLTWQLFLKGLRGETTVINISAGEPHTASRTPMAYVGTSTKQLEYGQNKTLADYNIHNESNLFVVLRLHGGSDEDPPPKQLPDDVELTDAPDMITWDDDPDGSRAKMPCGHAIGPESLTAYCESLLTSGKFRFLCPYIGPENGVYCGKEWDFSTVRKLAVLTREEKEKFEKRITENYLRKACGIQECPGCMSLCERNDKKDRRVVCPLCSKKKEKLYEFCWYCLHDWLNSSSTTKCGNSSCSNEDPRLKILRDSPKKAVVGVKDCPSRRACPQCGMLIEHERDCKHMVCPCGEKFCFICLKSAARGTYVCGSYNAPCTVAAIQTTIPGA
ncbi:unnamed protein product, partial [Owenia fusiformis]